MMRLSIRAEVRRRGAIGVFYPVTFLVDAPSMDRDQAREAWVEANGETWELHHIISIEPYKPTDPEA